MGYDFLIIGGGVIGLSIARELRRRGAGRVAVVERGRIGEEASWAAAGMLAPNAETHEEGPLFRFCTDSNAIYPRFAAQLFEETGIDVQLDRSGTLFLNFDETDGRLISEKCEWQIRAGIAVESLSREDLLAIEPELSPNVVSGLRYPSDGQVENRKLVTALRRSCELAGVSIFEGARVEEIIFDGDTAVGVRTPGVVIYAGAIVIANGAWTSELCRAAAIRPIRGQMICLAGGRRRLRSVIYSSKCYLVPRADGRVLVGSTVEDAGFRKEVLPEAIARFRTAALEISPSLASFDIVESWAGLRPFAADGLPVIGKLPGREGVFIAAGHYRNGILLAPLTAMVIADEILTGMTTEHFSAFRPARFVAADAAASR